MTPEINPDIRQRIVAAADQLYAQAGDGSIPNVDMVRRAARANMNDTSAVMKAWRRTRLTQAAVAPLAIPESVQHASSAGLEHLWRAAQECANQHLHAAQAGWEIERAESEALCQQLSKAFDEQANTAADQLLTLQATREAQLAAEDRSRAAAQALAEVRTGIAAATAQAERAETRASALEERLAEHKEQLARAHHELEGVRRETDATADGLRKELSTAIKGGADKARELAVAKAKCDALQGTAAAAVAHNRTLEQGMVKAEAAAMEAQARAAALSNEVEGARREVANLTASAQEARLDEASIRVERDGLALQVKQLLAKL